MVQHHPRTNREKLEEECLQDRTKTKTAVAYHLDKNSAQTTILATKSSKKSKYHRLHHSPTSPSPHAVIQTLFHSAPTFKNSLYALQLPAPFPLIPKLPGLTTFGP